MSETGSPPPSEGIRTNLHTEVSTDDATVRSKRSRNEGDVQPAAGSKRLRNDNDSAEMNPSAAGSKRPRNDEERLPINPPCGDESHQPEVFTLEDAADESYDTPSSPQRPHAAAAFTLGKKTIVVDINSGSTAHVLGHIQMVRSIFIVLFTFRMRNAQVV